MSRSSRATRPLRRPASLLPAVLLSVLLAGCSNLTGTGDLDYVPGNGGVVEFLGINIRDTSAANARSFELDRGVDYPSIYAPDGDALLAFTGRTSPRSTPTTLVLDESGVVVSLINGEIPSRTTLTNLVEDAGGPPAPAPPEPTEGEPADG